MAEIARWTTPSIIYKPSATTMDEVDVIFLTIKQSGRIVVEKTKEDAIETEEGFLWRLSQEETSLLKKTYTHETAVLQIDYKTVGGTRYTTHPKSIIVRDSGIQEVI